MHKNTFFTTKIRYFSMDIILECFSCPATAHLSLPLFFTHPFIYWLCHLFVYILNASIVCIKHLSWCMHHNKVHFIYPLLIFSFLTIFPLVLCCHLYQIFIAKYAMNAVDKWIKKYLNVLRQIEWCECLS